MKSFLTISRYYCKIKIYSSDIVFTLNHLFICVWCSLLHIYPYTEILLSPTNKMLCQTIMYFFQKIRNEVFYIICVHIYCTGTQNPFQIIGQMVKENFWLYFIVFRGTMFKHGNDLENLLEIYLYLLMLVDHRFVDY